MWVPTIQKFLNKHFKVRDRGNVSPMELLMGVRSKQALCQIVWTGLNSPCSPGSAKTARRQSSSTGCHNPADTGYT